MERSSFEDLIRWKYKTDRKPLIIKGARQVGKTWLMKEFARQEYERRAYLNFESSPHLKNIFAVDFDITRILTAISIEVGFMPDPRNTLIILDEIQEAERGLTSLKYFQENAPEYHVIAAGSLLGVALGSKTSFPVGKVDFLEIHPLTFIEFLGATGDLQLAALLDKPDWQTVNTFRNRFIERLKQYYFVGGMPQAVLTFTREQDFRKVREIQRNLLNAYDQDFSKHAPNSIVPRIRMLWNSIPSQLAKENRKFIYGLIREGARAKEYELAINWLTDCGLVRKVHNVSKPAIPLKAYEDVRSFKLFLMDVGLLGAMAGLDVKTILQGNEMFVEFKGALTEQYALQQLLTLNADGIYYWSPPNIRAEVDFLFQWEGRIVPIEVKAEENLQAKSLRVYQEKFKPRILVRTSMADFRAGNTLVNLPLYAVNVLTKLIP